MTCPIATTLRILCHFWLEEVKPGDAKTITALPELAQTLFPVEAATFTDLAVEYQRLFGFNLPPYESVFVDPSAMLMAPATERVQNLYQSAGWSPPQNYRAGAPDHVGLELLALADWLEVPVVTKPTLPIAGDLAFRLHTEHLALWVPAFVLALRRLSPHSFYTVLGELTLDLILTTLPGNLFLPNSDPFPALPPPAIYKASGDKEHAERDSAFCPAPEDEPATYHLRDLIHKLLLPREAGLFITREDIAHIGQALNAPGVMGERHRMLESVFHFAGQYDLLEVLIDLLHQLLEKTREDYRQLALEYPAWRVYADAWGQRVTQSQTLLEDLKQETSSLT